MEIINKNNRPAKKDFLKNAKIEKINDITLKYNNESIFDYYIIDLGNIFYKKTIDIICKYKNTLLYELYIEIENNKIKLLYVFDYKTKKRYKSDRFLKKYIQIALIGYILKDFNILE